MIDASHLLEFQAGNVVVFGKTLDGTHVLLANLAKGGRRRDREISLPAEKAADVAHGLQLWNVRSPDLDEVRMTRF